MVNTCPSPSSITSRRRLETSFKRPRREDCSIIRRIYESKIQNVYFGYIFSGCVNNSGVGLGARLLALLKMKNVSEILNGIYAFIETRDGNLATLGRDGAFCESDLFRY